MFHKIVMCKNLHNSQQNTFVGVSFFKKECGSGNSPLNFPKLLLTPFLWNTSSDCFLICGKLLREHL